jgi:SAM-dependent methyltransferase
MARVQLIELEDLPWMPARLRGWVVDQLSFIEDFVDAYRPIVPLVEELLMGEAEKRVVDLCSGSGAAPAQLKRALDARGVRCEVVLTDLYPNLEAFARRSAEGLRAVSEPVDARRVPDELAGVRTLFNAFHHLPPEAAQALLEDAARKGQPIVVVESVGRSVQAALLVCAITLGTFPFAPFVKPFSLGRLFFTYLVPLVPFIVFFDGMVSCLRVYSPRELEDMTRALESERYGFEIQRPKVPWAPVRHLVLVGRPR